MQTDKIRAIGISEGLSGRKLHDFLDFMRERFPDETNNSYIEEWAQRFEREVEWKVADGKSKKILKEINPGKYENKN